MVWEGGVPEGEATALREGARVEESRQTRRQTRSGRRSTRAAALENVVKRNGDKMDKRVELLKRKREGENAVGIKKRKRKQSEENLFRSGIKFFTDDKKMIRAGMSFNSILY